MGVGFPDPSTVEAGGAAIEALTFGASVRVYRTGQVAVTLVKPTTANPVKVFVLGQRFGGGPFEQTALAVLGLVVVVKVHAVAERHHRYIEVVAFFHNLTGGVGAVQLLQEIFDGISVQGGVRGQSKAGDQRHRRVQHQRHFLSGADHFCGGSNANIVAAEAAQFGVGGKVGANFKIGVAIAVELLDFNLIERQCQPLIKPQVGADVFFGNDFSLLIESRVL